jgi:hypothetical protein
LAFEVQLLEIIGRPNDRTEGIRQRIAALTLKADMLDEPKLSGEVRKVTVKLLHGWLNQAIEEVRRNNGRIDSESIRSKLEQAGRLASVGVTARDKRTWQLVDELLCEILAPFGRGDGKATAEDMSRAIADLDRVIGYFHIDLRKQPLGSRSLSLAAGLVEQIMESEDTPSGENFEPLSVWWLIDVVATSARMDRTTQDERESAELVAKRVTASAERLIRTLAEKAATLAANDRRADANSMIDQAVQLAHTFGLDPSELVFGASPSEPPPLV